MSAPHFCRQPHRFVQKRIDELSCKSHARNGCGNPSRGATSMKSKLSTALAAAGCVLALSIGAAKADLFDISGTFATGLRGTLSGTLDIHVTEPGIVTGINAHYSLNLGLA